MNVTYHKFVNGKLELVTETLDEDTLTKDKRISLEDWMNNQTSQGLPRKDVEKGSLYFWSPTDGSVVRFYAGAGRVDLDCDRDPAVSDPAVGVRVVREKK